MTEFKRMIGKFLVALIIVLSLFSFVITLQDDNNSPDKIRDQEVFNDSLVGLVDTIDDSTESAEEKYGVFNSEEPKTGIGSIVLFGIVSIGKTFSNIVFTGFGALIKLPLVILGIPESIYGLVLTWLIILIVVGVWLLYKLGG